MSENKSSLQKHGDYKELFTEFGYAMYMLQILEYMIINIIFFDDIPRKIKEAKTEQEWDDIVNSFYQKYFNKRTFGPIIEDIKKKVTCSDNLVALLERTLKQRNYLAHHLFRSNAAGLMNAVGKEKILKELVSAQELFTETRGELEELAKPINARVGFTDEVIDKLFEQHKAELGIEEVV